VHWENDSDFAVGDAVNHIVFGRGTVTKIEEGVLFVTLERNWQALRMLSGWAPVGKVQR